jgi:hypothetical protein
MGSIPEGGSPLFTNWHPGTQYLIPKDPRHFPAQRVTLSCGQISARWFRKRFQLKLFHLTMLYDDVQERRTCAQTAQGSRNIPTFSHCKNIYSLGVHIPTKHCYTPPRVRSLSDLHIDAGWSSPVARQAHNLKVVSSNLAPATNKPLKSYPDFEGFPFGVCRKFQPGHSWGTPEQENPGRY